MIVDTFPFFNELDLLECRLEEIYDAVDYVVAVEADVDHQGHPKPYYLSENLDRFDPWKDKLRVVRATDLPTVEEYPNAWWREIAQREHLTRGLAELDLGADDIIIHGDVDEIPRAVVARNVKPKGFVTLLQRGHFWAVDWLYPPGWEGTVCARVRDITSFGDMRNTRRQNPARQCIPDAGWHFSWLGGDDANLVKVNAFCHPETIPTITDAIVQGSVHRTQGIHSDGTKMEPVDVDRSWPAYIYERRCPESWFRPRDVAEPPSNRDAITVGTDR